MLNCKYCGSGNLQKRGYYMKNRRYYCKDCGRYPSERSVGDLFMNIPKVAESKRAKILVFDIETSLLRGYFFQLKTRYIRHDMVDQDRIILTWAAKWLGEDEIISASLTPREAKRRDDSRITRRFWNLLNEADIIIAHNGDRFDVPHMMAKFFEHGINPPLPFRRIDTLKVARRNFGGFISKSLSYLTSKLKINGKIETNVQLWKDCGNGDRVALAKMLAYNENDILILEDLYMLIRPWISNHPNLGMYNSNRGEMTCPVCEGEIKIEDSAITTMTNSWKTYRCTDCGKTGRTMLSALDKEERRFFITR